MADLSISVDIDATGTKQGADTAKSAIRSIKSVAEVDLKALGDKLKSAGERMKQMGGELQSFGTQMSLAITAPLVALGTLGVKSALEVDAVRTKITALVGDSEKANAKIIELRELSAKSVGVTQKAALDTYAQLKGIGGIAEDSINRVISAMGKLNAAFKIEDQAGFIRNQVQLFSQGFEIPDLKEAVGRVPIFYQLLEQAFGTKDPEKLRALKEAGALTLDSFMTGLSDAIQSDPRTANITDNLSTKIAKAMERLDVALAPLGQVILDIVVPALEKVSPVIENLGKWFQSLSPGVQTAVVAFAELVAAIGPLLVVAGTLITAIGTIVSAVGTVVAAIGGGSVLALALAGLGVILAEIAVGVGVFYLAWTNNFGGIRDLTKMVADFVVEVWNAAMAAIKELTAAVTAELVRFWQENGEQIKQAWQEVSDIAREIWTKIADWFRENGDTIKAIVSAVWDFVKTFIVSAIRVIADVITIFLKATKGDWQGAWEAMKDLVKVVFEAIGAFIRAQVAVIVGLVTLIFNGIWALNAEVFKKAHELGDAIGRGIRDGILAMKQRVINAASELANQIPQTVRTLLNIQSPSKVMRDIGLQVAQGLIEGIFAGGNGVSGAADSLGKRIVKSLTGVLGNFLQQITGRGFSGISGGSSAGGGFFGNILGGIFGGGGMGPGGTPMWNPSSGGGSSSGGGGLFGGGGFGGWWRGLLGDRTGTLDAAGNVIVDGRGGWTKFFSSPLFSGLLTGGIGLLIGGIGKLIGRNKLRRQEEGIRNQGIRDAFEALKQFDDIIRDVRTLRMDGASGIAAGTQLGQSVRAQYLEMANSLKDKKTRSHALKDVYRVDLIIKQKMAELRAVAEVANAAAERDRRLIPEFAKGVFMSPAFMAFRRMNGMLGGTFTGRDTIPAMLGHGEMVLNPRQMAAIRANAGFDVFKTANIPGYANGGMANTQTAEAMPLNIQIYVEQDANGMWKASAQSPGNRKVMVDIVSEAFANDELKLRRR